MQDFDPHPIDPELRSRQINDLVRQFSPRFDIGRTHSKDILPFDFSPGEIIIGDDVWIGANAIILKDVKIGDGSIVAAGAVVTKGSYPPKSILAGNPAKVVKTI
jgi:acetyltransferase-like isoleucine patch superfamily enzyme